MEESQLPQGDWHCHECTAAPADLDKIAAMKGKASMKQICNRILQALTKHEFSTPFSHPVEGIPEYEDVIDQPMDFETVGKQVKADKYASLQEFAEDIN